MPSTGTPASYSAASIDGAWSTWTDAGPPERMIPFGRRASISSNGIVRGTISEYTCASRTRRAISCAYCAPKSTTSTVSNGGVRPRCLYRPMPTPWLRWRLLPSVCNAGATMTSAFWNSLTDS